ncbi:TonB-dependent receptor plug domain-containing protein [Muricauda sp. NFXS6]|uniref:M56 family metallopeptidase n=1 Tax=Allomuricauda sp. NFXS6 TaxID=2819094 RepID=UPI0032DE4B38|tara:strand:- start:29550 stop:31322 length:1773 start_codon:yes stop_codon:yes gene_type:complete
MEPIFLYFLQSALISGAFLAVYHIFLKRDTLFKENRLFLLSGLVLAFVFPLIKIQKTIVVSQATLVQAVETSEQIPLNTTNQSIYTLENILLSIYIVVSLFLFIRFISKLVSLKKLAKNARKRRETPFLHMETEKPISPFSFFNYLFYNPRLFESNELHSVLEHEKVHARQLHTLDILLLELLKIFFWFNPVLWIYKSAVRQNLEYLADHFAIAQAKDKKSYQYLMLKQVVDTQEHTLASSFYNSLIKKRIVMLNQNQSKKVNVLKTLVMLPLLGLFLASFSIEETYLYKDSDSVESLMTEENSDDNKTVELTIDKNTTDVELDKIKKDLGKDDIDFSYTTVRNDDKEIIEISLQLSGKNSEGKSFSGNYNSNSDGPIGPITVFYDDANNAVSFWNAGKSQNVQIHQIKGKSSWTTDDNTEIIIKEGDEEKEVIVNGKRLTEKEMEDIDLDNVASIFVTKDEEDENIRHVTIKKVGEKKHKNVVMIKTDDEKEIEVKESKNVMVIRDSDDDEDIEVISGDDDASYFFIDNDGKGEPLYYIDGKKSKSKDLKKISPNDIESVNVFKGDKAIEKYGKKAKDGVIEITTKKNE